MKKDDSMLVARVRELLVGEPRVTEEGNVWRHGVRDARQDVRDGSFEPDQVSHRPSRHVLAIRQLGCQAVLMRGKTYPGCVHIAADLLYMLGDGDIGWGSLSSTTGRKAGKS